MSIGWTDERVDELRKLWGDGLSASQIAKELGWVTRNAVIGKVHRLGLSGRAKGPSQARMPGQKRVARGANYVPRAPRVNGRLNGDGRMRGQNGTSRAIYAAQEIIAAPEPLRIELTELSERTCKWPYGDPVLPDFYFCGCDKDDGPQPYCRYHSRLAFQPILDRRRAAQQ